jgi:hypothetical protein
MPPPVNVYASNVQIKNDNNAYEDALEVVIPDKYFHYDQEGFRATELKPIRRGMTRPLSEQSELKFRKRGESELPHVTEMSGDASDSDESNKASVLETLRDKLQRKLLGKLKRVFSKNVKDVEDNLSKLLLGVKEAGETVNDPLLETLNYDNYEDYIVDQQLSKDTKYEKIELAVIIFRVLFSLFVGLVTSLIGYFLLGSLEFLIDKKFESVKSQIEEGDHAGAYFTLVGICLGYTLVSSLLCTFLAPDARGSGVPYVLGYVNGTNMGSFFHWRIVLVKIIALMFTIAVCKGRQQAVCVFECVCV